jgi:hypothetical protein
MTGHVSSPKHDMVIFIELKENRPEQYLLLGLIFIGPGNVNNDLVYSATQSIIHALIHTFSNTEVFLNLEVKSITFFL